MQQHEYTSHPAYMAFLMSLKTPITKDTYSKYLQKYYLNRPENKNLTLDQILSKTPKTIEYEIIGIINQMRQDNLSYAAISTFLAAIQHFLQINDIMVNKVKINKFKGENIAKYEYRSYTHDEIASLLEISNERAKAAILLMASTGMRVGALIGLKIKHLIKWNVPHLSHYHVYQIIVYANSPKDKYYTFCTPEAAKAVDNYLDIRKRYGLDIESPDVPLFIYNFDQSEVKITPTIAASKPNTAITDPEAISKIVVRSLEKVGLRKRIKLPKGLTRVERSTIQSRHRNELHPCHSLRIFAVTNMQRAKVDKTIREMIMGHATGLDRSYYKPQEEEILEEYLKAVDNLTISNEYRLKKQLDYYKYRQDQIDELALKFKELDERMKRDGL